MLLYLCLKTHFRKWLFLALMIAQWNLLEHTMQCCQKKDRSIDRSSKRRALVISSSLMMFWGLSLNGVSSFFLTRDLLVKLLTTVVNFTNILWVDFCADFLFTKYYKHKLWVFFFSYSFLLWEVQSFNWSHS